MLSNTVQKPTCTQLVPPASAADTAAATSAWVAVPLGEGDVQIVQDVGAVTGSITGTLQTADDASGTNAAAVTPNEGAFAAVSASDSLQVRTVNRAALSAYVKYTGTIATGPVLVGVAMLTHPKYL